MNDGQGLSEGTLVARFNKSPLIELWDGSFGYKSPASGIAIYHQQVTISRWKTLTFQINKRCQPASEPVSRWQMLPAHDHNWCPSCNVFHVCHKFGIVVRSQTTKDKVSPSVSSHLRSGVTHVWNSVLHFSSRKASLTSEMDSSETPEDTNFLLFHGNVNGSSYEAQEMNIYGEEFEKTARAAHLWSQRHCSGDAQRKTLVPDLEWTNC